MMFNILFIVHCYFLVMFDFLFVENNFLFMLLKYLFPVAGINYLVLKKFKNFLQTKTIVFKIL